MNYEMNKMLFFPSISLTFTILFFQLCLTCLSILVLLSVHSRSIKHCYHYAQLYPGIYELALLCGAELVQLRYPPFW